MKQNFTPSPFVPSPEYTCLEATAKDLLGKFRKLNEEYPHDYLSKTLGTVGRFAIQVTLGPDTTTNGVNNPWGAAVRGFCYRSGAIGHYATLNEAIEASINDAHRVELIDYEREGLPYKDGAGDTILLLPHFVDPE